MEAKPTRLVTLESTFKSGAELELTQCMMLVGKSGMGKSSITDSMSLLLTGEAYSDGLGKDSAQLKHCTQPGMAGIDIAGTLDDGSVVHWVLNKGGKALWKRSTEDGAKMEPIASFYGDEVNAILKGAQTRIRAAILKAAQQQIAMHRLLDECSKDTHDMLVRFFKKAKIEIDKTDEGKPRGSQMFTIERIESLIKVVKARRTELNKAVKNASATQDIALEKITSAEEDELADLLAQQTFESELPINLQDANDRLQTVIPRLEKRKRELVEMQPIVEESVIEATQYQLNLADSLYQAGLEIITAMHAQNTETSRCIFCGTSVDLDTLNWKLKDLKATQQAQADWLEKVGQQNVERRLLESTIAGLEKLQAALYEIATQGYLTKPVDQNRIEKLKTKQAAASAVKASFASKADSEAELLQIKSMLEGIEKILTEAVETSAALIEKKINRFLPKNIRVRLDKDGKHVWARGFVKDSDEYFHYRALSGAQRCMIAVAFAAATIRDDGAPIKMLIIDDVAMDNKIAKTLMQSIANHIAEGGGFTQAVVSLLSWGGKNAVDGWSLVSLDPKPKARKRPVDPTKPKPEPKPEGAGEGTES